MDPSGTVLISERLRLRPFVMEDAPAVAGLAGAREIARCTTRIPHPYQEEMAREWISTHAGGWARREHAIFAVSQKDTESLIGAVGLEKIHREFFHAEIGYWIGVPFWNRGFGTEAVAAVVTYGFSTLDLHRIYARIMSGNRGSAKVLEKCGFSHEGTMKEHVYKNGKFVDIEIYGILTDEPAPGCNEPGKESSAGVSMSSRRELFRS
ncbi:RimJ/RimL family protein N-acetyltransferase [Methanolinea mesophila]|uniref:GNAT family N-acetyltransferase n=1 Tax=Methanolinea mesophila TaxID=547055 RepID=UPI001AE91E2E|nr:GNAT family N-acetyltransferase [Methanolinea mesophila]MBP1928795.1 RimJ/RimL family protein N-acetyltransferase [Methanolinea mesophila]